MKNRRAIHVLRREIAFIERFHSGSDARSFSSGFSGIESGPCCRKCRMPDSERNPLRRLVGCRDPFQINCKCHIPFRKVAKASELQLLKHLIWLLQR